MYMSIKQQQKDNFLNYWEIINFDSPNHTI